MNKVGERSDWGKRALITKERRRVGGMFEKEEKKKQADARVGGGLRQGMFLGKHAGGCALLVKPCIV
ncbi:hypothetical protein HF325_003873 [Metschnikowia pulcherrima]|uniref:Uncharacterized protein n=1 Tax=Metschnikowia pulcherrima TaxID=27326 RepID=A0A8H7GRS4_9ASCO|nr:hypothetical protein HF325_003873 [Metschnikowia pulcherrima]